MIDDGGDIDATPEVLKSELVGRLIEQRVQVQRELAQLSATLLPSHPRIKQLNSELADVREQIRDEAAKNVKGLKNEAEVASARETSLRNSLNDSQARASRQGDAEISFEHSSARPRPIAICSNCPLLAIATRAPVTTWALSRPRPRSSPEPTHRSCRVSPSAARCLC